MNQVEWLLVGAGDISRKSVAAALAGAKGSKLLAVCDIQKEQARSLAERFGVTKVFGDLAEALASSSADAVYLATPVWLHVPQAVQVLEAGKHVLVEKPLGLNVSECSRVVAAARSSGKLASCAYYRRFYPRYAYTKNMLDKSEFGPIVSVHLTYSSWFSPAPDDAKRWRVIRAKSGGGPLFDMGSHMFDVLIGLFGLPETVYAKCLNLVHHWDVEDSAVVILKLRCDALAEARFNWNSKTWRHEFEIVGSEASLDWFPYDSGPLIKTVGRHTERIELPRGENVHLPLIEDFVQSVLVNRAPFSSVGEAIKTNILLDAIYQSSTSGLEVKVD